MIQHLFNRSANIVRQVSDDIDRYTTDIDDNNVVNALAYFQRENDHDLVRDALKRRFAIGITQLKGGASDKLPSSSPSSSDVVGFETYTKSRIAEQIESGEIEVVTSGIGNKVISSLANLFSMKTQSWEYLNESGEKDENVSEVMSSLRNGSNFENEICNADWISSGIESCAVLVTWKNDSLSYKAIPPSHIKAKFGEYLTDNGEMRAVDKTDIEDATFVSIKLSSGIGYSENQYLGIFGRSEIYPLGRYVVYSGKNWDTVPDVGDPGVFDWQTAGGEIANPLSWYAETSGHAVPEFPIISVRGGMIRVTDKLFPISTSLFENCLEFDIAESRLVKDGLNAARGKDVITNTQGVPLPRSLEGAVVMQSGQTLEVTGRPALHSAQALEVTRDIARGVAEGYDVPSHEVMSDSVTDLSSGVAIHLRTKPLIRHREDRIKINRKDVDKLFHVERALFNIHSGNDIPMDIVQIWNPGRYVDVESEMEKNTRLKSAMDNGFISYVRAVRDYHEFPTDADAEAYIERLKDQNSDNPAPKTRNGTMPFGFK